MSHHDAARRDFLARAGALAGSALLPAPAFAQSNELVVATFGGLFEKILRASVIPEFSKARNTTVALQLGVGTTFIPKIVAAPRRSPFDVVYVNDDEAFLGQDLGLWLPDQSKQLKNIGDIFDEVKPPKLPLYSTSLYEFPLAYRPAKMPEPKSWNDLWRPGITVAVPHISNSYGLTFLMIAALLNGGSASNLGPGFDAIKRLPRFKIYKGVTDGFNMFQQGEVDAGLFYGHRVQQLKEQGVPLAAARPAEGVYGQRTGCQIPKAAANKELALAWIDEVLGAPAQLAFARELYSPTNRQVKLPPEVADKQLVTAERLAQLKFPPWSVLNPQRDELLTRWNKEIAS